MSDPQSVHHLLGNVHSKRRAEISKLLAMEHKPRVGQAEQQSMMMSGFRIDWKRDRNFLGMDADHPTAGKELKG